MFAPAIWPLKAKYPDFRLMQLVPYARLWSWSESADHSLASGTRPFESAMCRRLRAWNGLYRKPLQNWLPKTLENWPLADAPAGVQQTTDFRTPYIGGPLLEAGMVKRIAVYVRVSTGSQTVENQEQQLRHVAATAGWRIVKVYCDARVSGARRRDQRPAFKQMCDDAARRQFDMVAAWSVDRLGRSLQDLVGFLSDLDAMRIDLYLHQQAIDTSSPAGRALFQMLGVFAEFERSLIRERVMSGLQRARAEGTTLGRPRIDKTVEGQIKQLLKTGNIGIRAMARQFEVGTGTVQRVKLELEKSETIASTAI